MKKIILITIVCCLIPCLGFAQEFNSRLRIADTLWEATVDESENLGFGFSGRKVYLVWPLDEGEPAMVEKSFYVSLVAFSIASVANAPDIVPGTIFPGGIGILFPLLERGFFLTSHGILQVTALQDNWTP